MKAEERRAQILRLLQERDEPLSGSALAKLLGVSRQIVVQDMALLRAGTDREIVSTYQGYVLLKKKMPCTRVFKVRHGTDRTREELQQKGYFSLKFPEQKVYCGTIFLFILVNLILGMASQPILSLIAQGLHHFA